MPPPLDLLPALLEGLVVTAELTLSAAALAIFAAFLARLFRNPLLKASSRIYVDLFRGTSALSALVQLFWVYFALPLLGVRLDAMAAGIIVLGLNAGSYGSEVVRGAIQAVPREQYEAAAALNLSARQTMWRVIVPQAALAMIPPFGNLFIELLKARRV